MLKRHILKNNKHSSVPFWWPGALSKPGLPPASFSPVSQNSHQAATVGATKGQGTGGGPREG